MKALEADYQQKLEQQQMELHEQMTSLQSQQQAEADSTAARHDDDLVQLEKSWTDKLHTKVTENILSILAHITEMRYKLLRINHYWRLKNMFCILVYFVLENVCKNSGLLFTN